MSWTEEKVAKLKELWGKNTASQIAEILGGVSRNAVIGKANRLNLSAKIKTRTAATNENFNNEDLKVIFKDYYFSNVIARASKTMLDCNNAKLEIKISNSF